MAFAVHIPPRLSKQTTGTSKSTLFHTDPHEQSTKAAFYQPDSVKVKLVCRKHSITLLVSTTEISLKAFPPLKLADSFVILYTITSTTLQTHTHPISLNVNATGRAKNITAIAKMFPFTPLRLWYPCLAICLHSISLTKPFTQQATVPLFYREQTYSTQVKTFFLQ